MVLYILTVHHHSKYTIETIVSFLIGKYIHFFKIVYICNKYKNNLQLIFQHFLTRKQSYIYAQLIESIYIHLEIHLNLTMKFIAIYIFAFVVIATVNCAVPMNREEIIEEMKGAIENAGLAGNEETAAQTKLVGKFIFKEDDTLIKPELSVYSIETE